MEVSRVDLPVGPAARVHLLDAAPGSVADGADVPVVESVTHLSGVALVTSWPALLAAEQLVAEADRLASTLTITP